MALAELKPRLPSIDRNPPSEFPACMFGIPSTADYDSPLPDRTGLLNAEPVRGRAATKSCGSEQPQQQHGQVTVTNATSTTDDYPHVEGSEAWAPPAPPCQVPMPAHAKKRASLRRTAAAKAAYKHVPHKDKPPHLVARRNARERRRVQAVNSAFSRLRRCVPVENRSKRLSKVKTLHKAIEYINYLQDLLDEADAQIQASSIEYTHPPRINKKENGEGHTSWTSTIDMVSCRQEEFEAFTSFYEGYVDYQN